MPIIEVIKNHNGEDSWWQFLKKWRYDIFFAKYVRKSRQTCITFNVKYVLRRQNHVLGKGEECLVITQGMACHHETVQTDTIVPCLVSLLGTVRGSLSNGCGWPYWHDTLFLLESIRLLGIKGCLRRQLMCFWEDKSKTHANVASSKEKQNLLGTLDACLGSRARPYDASAKP